MVVHIQQSPNFLTFEVITYSLTLPNIQLKLQTIFGQIENHDHDYITYRETQ